MSNTKVVIPDDKVEEKVEEAAVVDDPSPEVGDEDEGVQVESLPADEELWEGGPTAGDVVAWKKEHGEVYLTSITLDKHIIWRPIRRSEYREHIKNMELLVDSGKLSPADANLYNEEAIAELCILFPEYDRNEKLFGLAGIPAIISQEVLEASGFTALDVRQL